MKVFLVWKRESYCDYDVVKVFDSIKKAKEWIKEYGNDDEYSYEIKERNVE